MPLLKLATIDPVATGLAGQIEQKERTEFRNEEWKGENKPRCEQTECDVSSSTHHMINSSRPSPTFYTVSDKSWLWRPGTRQAPYSDRLTHRQPCVIASLASTGRQLPAPALSVIRAMVACNTSIVPPLEPPAFVCHTVQSKYESYGSLI